MNPERKRQIRIALAGITPGRWRSGRRDLEGQERTARDTVYVAFDDPEIRPEAIAYEQEEQARYLAEWQRTWDAATDEERARSIGDGHSRDVSPRRLWSYGGDLICESVGEADAALIADAPTFLAELLEVADAHDAAIALADSARPNRARWAAMKAEIRAALAGGEANQPLLENAARWFGELLAEDDRREALAHVAPGRVPPETIERLRAFVENDHRVEGDWPDADEVDGWIRELLAERDAADSAIVELCDVPHLAAGAPPELGVEPSEVITALAREVVKLRAQAAEVARATAGESFAALVLRGMPDNPEERAAVRAAVRAMMAEIGRQPPAPILDMGPASTDQVERLAAAAGARFVGDGVIAVPKAVADREVDAMRAALAARSSGAWVKRPNGAWFYVWAEGAEVEVCESVRAVDVDLLANAPRWIESLLAERGDLLEQNRRLRGVTVEPASLPPIGAPPAERSLGANAPTDVARFELGQYAPIACPKCGEPVLRDSSTGNALWHGGDGVTACDYRGPL